MDMERTQEMLDIVHGAVAYSGIEQIVIAMPIFSRLHKVLQNSLVYLTYPANKVKRFEHSVGTMHLAGQFFMHSVCNSDPVQLRKFFAEVEGVLKDWNKRAELHYVDRSDRQKYKGEKIFTLPYPQCPLYFKNTPANLPAENRLCYYIVYQAIRLVGLLHDVGHLPYSHLLEQALQKLYKKVSQLSEKDQNDAHRYFLQIMAPYCADNASKQAIHEELGQKYVEIIFKFITEECLRKGNINNYFLHAVIYFTKSILSADEGENSLFSDLHRIVASTLDCDRMDYCCRDEYNAGMSKELPEYHRIFSTVHIVYRKTDPGLVYEDVPPEARERCYFMPSTKALKQIEGLLHRRWDIYAAINFHHSVHKHEVIFEEVLVELGLREMENGKRPKELENVLPLKISSIWQIIAQMNEAAPIEYIALQLDDSWLDTVLNHKFFEEFNQNYMSFKENSQNVFWHRMDELISGQKHYYSLIKRSGRFRLFDMNLYDQIKLKQKTDGFSVECNLCENYTQFIKEGEYLFNFLLRNVAYDKIKRKEFFERLNQRVADMLNASGQDYHIQDCLLADSSFSMGIQLSDPLYITSSTQDEKPFVHYSPLYNVLSMEKKLLPSFHIYYLPEYDIEHGEYYKVDANGFLADIARQAMLTIEELVSPKQ